MDSGWPLNKMDKNNRKALSGLSIDYWPLNMSGCLIGDPYGGLVVPGTTAHFKTNTVLYKNLLPL